MALSATTLALQQPQVHCRIHLSRSPISQDARALEYYPCCSRSTFSIPSDRRLEEKRFRSRAGRRFVVRAAVEEKEEVESKPSGKGWFYDKFVAENTWQAKLKKLEKTMEEQGNVVNTYFDGAFKYTIWMEVYKKLVERKLESIPVQEAFRRSKEGVLLLDCREPQDFAKIHAGGAKNAPLFRLIQGDDMKSNMRRLGYAFIADFAGTERNPNFVEDAVKAVGGDKSRPIIVYCSPGGTLKTVIEKKGKKPKSYKDPERAWGKASRSLKAIYELQEAGFTNIVHMEGGLNQWLHEDLPAGGSTVEDTSV